MSGDGDGWFGFSLRPPVGMVLIGSRRLSWFPSSLRRGAGELDSFRLSRERVQPALDGRLSDSHLEAVCSGSLLFSCPFDWF